ncbi:uncharacterized protein F54H12.2-like [Centruroides sculpturatus]|uniref:uncharacterized protein F54H12.2-like n=1 Tax=Centruroides sculpturatus TaxID=218467 RepID=UPI000C6E7FAC|nr:uncharacterized protein F54H12.2-like [Centruroides sculpturatus]
MNVHSCGCTKSELDLFKNVGIQLAIDNTYEVTAHPVAAINDSRSPIEFLISGSGEHYMDLHSIYLCVQAKIVKKDGSNLGSEEKVTPVNYFLNSLFSQCTVYLNDKLVITQVNYPYRAILDALLFNSKEVQETFLTSALFFKDTAGQMDSINPLDENNTNYGLVKRFNISKGSRIIDLMGRLHIDLANQPKLLTNNVDLRIKLERSKENFALMADNDNYKIIIKNASLKINKVDVSSSIQIGIEKALQTALIKLPFRRTDVKVFTLTSGIQSTSISNVVIGQLPYRITLGLVSNSAFNGNVKRNPFNFKNYDLNYICLSKDNQMIPSKPYTPDYTNKIYARNFISLFEDTGCIHHHKSINISYDEYRDGYTLYCFDLTPDKSGSENHVSVNELGNISVELKFSKAIPETINVICLLEYNNTLEIDHSRTVFVDY